jgi:hypothetical protein
MMNHKTSVTVKPYRIKFKGWHFVIKKGTVVSNDTAMGPDDNYRFIGSNPKGQLISLESWWSGGTALPLTLLHDLKYHGIDIPAEYCKPYEE